MVYEKNLDKFSMILILFEKSYGLIEKFQYNHFLNVEFVIDGL